MERLIIKNIGPIKNIDITLNKINVFIGAQSSGKSTISKILCHCQWVEKTCYLNDEYLRKYNKKGVFYESLIEYHRLEGYFNKEASIEYIGMYLTIIYTQSYKKITITKTKQTGNITYSYPKISYIPSERNLVAAISNFGKFNGLNDVIAYFGYDWEDAKKAILKVDLSNLLERNISYEYKNDNDYIKDGDVEIALKVASSGILSLLPLYLTVSYMCDILKYKKDRNLSAVKSILKRQLTDNISIHRSLLMSNKNFNINDLTFQANLLLSDIEASDFISQIKERKINDANSILSESLSNLFDKLLINSEKVFEYEYSQLFIEEPEQNLFPEAQKKLVYNIISQINSEYKDHRLCITTHSPYVLYALNNCMLGGLINEKMPMEEKEELNSYKQNAWIHPDNVNLWQIKDGELVTIKNDKTGTVGQHYFNEVMSNVMEEYYEMLTYLDCEN